MNLIKEILRIKHLISEVNFKNNPNKVVKGELYYKYLDRLKERYSETPELVIEEFLDNNVFNDGSVVKRIENTYYGDILIEIRGYWDWFLQGPWELETLRMNYNDFSRTTKKCFIDRNFGLSNTYMVPDDKERTEYQMKTQTGQGDNLPVLLISTKDGYELVEGWHRVMAILKLSDNGNHPSTWLPQKIKAYIHR